MLQNPNIKINIKGVALGDACLGTDVLCTGKDLILVGPYFDLIFLYGHGQLPNSFYTDILTICSIAELKTQTWSPACGAKVSEMYEIVGEFFSYNLESYCPTSVGGKRKRFPSNNLPISGYPCPGNAMGDWIARSDVRTALNVPTDSFFFNSDNGNNFNYTPSEKDVRPLCDGFVKSGIKLLIYGGDTDPSLSTFRTQDAWFGWLEEKGL